jgi:hypothetical protein
MKKYLLFSTLLLIFTLINCKSNSELVGEWQYDSKNSSEPLPDNLKMIHSFKADGTFIFQQFLFKENTPDKLVGSGAGKYKLFDNKKKLKMTALKIDNKDVDNKVTEISDILILSNSKLQLSYYSRGQKVIITFIR